MKLKNYAYTVAGFLMLASAANAQSIMGITTNNELFKIDNPSIPATISSPVAITGLGTGQTIAGTDFRPATGELYALGYDATSGNAQLYTINVTSALATPVGASMTLALGTGSIGFDFNPTVDRIRVTGANRKNYRLHPVTGAIAATDGELTFAATDVNSASIPSIGASAYTNSYIGSEATTLYNYDENLNIITTQAPPNNGTQNTIGASGIVINTSDRSIDMDIFFDKASGTNISYLSANTISGNDMLYTVNLSTGATTSLGLIGTGIQVKDIAVVINRTIPAATSPIAYGLTKTNGNLISFETGNPSFIRSLTPVTGVTAAQKIVGMDFRPADRALYALGYNATSMEYQLYTINTTTGVATAVNATPGILNLGNSGNVAFDFNPVPDRIRVISGLNGNNYRLNPNDGAIAATDTALSYTTGDVNAGVTPYIGSVAYTNSYPGATATLLHGIDDSTGTFVTINPPNGGKLNTLLPNVMALNPADPSLDIDIYFDSTSMANSAFLVSNMSTGVNDNLYALNLSNGSITLIDKIGFGIPVTDLAISVTYTNTPPPVVGINDVQGNKKSLLIYPNPANETLYFENLKANKANIIITDLSGRLIQNSIVKNNAVSIINLSKGSYILQVSIDGESYKPVKFIKE